MPVVSIRSAVCVLGRFPALAGADLDVDEGEVVLLSGANGAGKSTLLRLLAGLVPLRSGRVEVLGHDLARERAVARSQLALVGHETFCYDDLTVGENLRFAARAAGADPSGTAEAAAASGLGAHLDVPHGRLSAGQRRRLALAVARARSPRLWLLDEPHAGLDAGGRDLVDRTVAEAVERGSTVLVASHELDRVRSLAHREVRLVAGRCEPVPAAPGAVVPVPALPSAIVPGEVVA